MWTITCPYCGFLGSDEDFSCSCADELSCPKCGWSGLLEYPDDDEPEED